MRRAFVIFILFSFFLISCSDVLNPEETKYSVKYAVTGTAKKVSITIENENGGTSQFSDVSVPWSYTFPVKKKPGTFVYVSAQNEGSSGSVTVKIYRDGKVFKSSTSSGAYVIATASGTL